MHIDISYKNLVALLKCAPLHPNQIWSKYAYRTVRIHADNQLSAEEILRTPCERVRRSDKGMDSLPLKPYACPYVRATLGMQQSEGTYGYHNRPW